LQQGLGSQQGLGGAGGLQQGLGGAGGLQHGFGGAGGGQVSELQGALLF